MPSVWTDNDIRGARLAAGMMLNLLGTGEVAVCRNIAAGRGIDPETVASTVRSETGATMTPLPRAQLDDVDVADRDGALVVTAPVWTEDGASSLHLELTCLRNDNATFDVFIAELLGVQGALTAGVPAALGDDLRIPRTAFVGATSGVLMAQLTRQLRAAGLDPTRPDGRATAGQAAVYLLDFAIGQLYGDGVEAMLERLGPNAVDQLQRACTTIGSVQYAELFARLRSTDSETWEDLFFALEDTVTIWDEILAFVDSDPTEFFLHGTSS